MPDKKDILKKGWEIKMKMTVEDILNEEVPQTQVKAKKEKAPKNTPAPKPADGEEIDVPPISKGSKVFATVIFIAGMMLLSFVLYMIIGNLSPSPKGDTKEKTTTEVVEDVTEETTVTDTTSVDEQIKKLQAENAELKASLAAEKQKNANSANYDQTINDLNEQLKQAQAALSESQSREQALQQQLNGQTAEKQ